MSEESFASLKKLLQSHGIGGRFDIKQVTESSTSALEEKIDTIIINGDLDSSPTISNAATTTASNSKNVFFANLNDFYTHSMTIIANPYNNFYHTSLKFSLEHTRFILDKILFSQRFFLCWFIIFTVLFLASQIYWYVIEDDDVVYMTIYIGSQLVATMTGICYTSTANVDIALWLIQTFDFWYKMYNMIAAIIFIRFLDYYANWVTYCISQITFISVAVGIYLFDAICVSSKKKWILNTALVGVFIDLIVFVYFQTENVYWNPFGTQHTQIDFKALVISSYTNVVLFVLKPMFATFGRWCRHVTHTRSCTTNHDKSNGKLVQRSDFLHKRPMIKWHVESDQIDWLKESQCPNKN